MRNVLWAADDKRNDSMFLIEMLSWKVIDRVTSKITYGECDKESKCAEFCSGNEMCRNRYNVEYFWGLYVAGN